MYLGKKQGNLGELEKQCGLSAGYLSRRLKLNRSISLHDFLKFTDALGVKISFVTMVDIEKKELLDSLHEQIMKITGYGGIEDA